jgi:hypothetical protein
MVVIPAGVFLIGWLRGRGPHDEEPVHPVRIRYLFAVGKYEVTQAEWRSVMGNNPSSFKEDRNPVEQVSWKDAKVFMQRLSARTGKAVPPSERVRVGVRRAGGYADLVSLRIDDQLGACQLQRNLFVFTRADGRFSQEERSRSVASRPTRLAFMTLPEM